MQNTHSHGNAGFDLLGYEAYIGIVGDIGANLNAAVHRAGMHNKRAFFGISEFSAVQSMKVKIFAFGRHKGSAHALKLKAEHHHNVTPFKTCLHIVEHVHTPFIDICR